MCGPENFPRCPNTGVMRGAEACGWLRLADERIGDGHVMTQRISSCQQLTASGILKGILQEARRCRRAFILIGSALKIKTYTH